MEIDHEGASSSSWRRLQRSNSLILASELAADSSGFRKISGYRRLSQSMRAGSDFGGFLCKPTNLRKRRANNWTEKVGKLFSFNKNRLAKKKQPGVDVVMKKKKGSSWLPDPDRRWPVQGW